MLNVPLSLQAARQYQAAGLCAIPIRLDGSKAPAVHEWTTYKNRLITTDEVAELFGKTEQGVAIICGAVSRNLETLDFETADIYQQWAELVKAVQPNLLNKLIITQTPGKYDQPGRHVRYRLKDMPVPGNTKLAMSENGKDCLIETRGEGGYALAPGSPAEAHPTKGTYKNIQGKITEVREITAKEREVLIGCAQSLNQYIADTTSDYKPSPNGEAGDRPGDKYNQAGDFSILQKHGWKLVSQNDTRCLWKRPGKDTPGISATTGYCKGKDGTPRLYVFSTNAAPFEANKYYSAFSVLALLEHGGDFSKAGKSLAQVATGKVTISSLPPELSSQEEHISPDGEVHVEANQLEPFPIGVFPEKLQRLMQQLSDVIPCPIETVGCVLLGFASLGVGNTRRLRLKKTWVETACLYLCVVAEPGEGKTPVMQLLNKPMYDWQDILQQQFQQKKLDYQQDLETWEAAKKAGTAGAKPIKPIFPHVYTTDATPEKLIEMLAGNPRGVAYDQDELVALVKGMNQYKQGGKGRERPFFLSVWSGVTAKVDRKSHEEPLIAKNPFVPIFGGIQPQMIGVLKDEFGREDGFVHRFLVCYPQNRILSPWNTKEVDQQCIDDWNNCFNKLLTLSMHLEESNKLRPWICHLTQAGYDAWKAGYDSQIEVMRSIDRQFGGPYHKLNSYAARLSLIMQMLYWACDGADDKTVDAKAVEAGWYLVKFFASHMKRVYTQLHDRPEDMRAKEYIAWVNSRGGKVTQRDAMRYGPMWCRKQTAINDMFKDLQDRGLGKMCLSKNKNGTETLWFEAGET